LVVAQHLPIERATEVFAECCGVAVSSGFATSLIGEAAGNLDGFVVATRSALRQSPVLHLDETGAQFAGRLGWVHSASTSSLTAYLFHRRQGRVAVVEFIDTSAAPDDPELMGPQRLQSWSRAPQS
jgi:transposase